MKLAYDRLRFVIGAILTALLLAACTTLTITQQPTSVTVMAGQSATFSVVVQSKVPPKKLILRYQWYRGTTAISGATASSYTLASAALADNGAVFHVVVFDGVSTVSSNDATLTVTNPQPQLSFVAGSLGGPGNVDGTGNGARFLTPAYTAVDGTGNVYVSDTWSNTIRKITPAGVVTTVAGTPSEAGSADGTGSAAQFEFPMGMAIDTSGNIYIADEQNDTIRKMTPAGVVSTLAGSPKQSGDVDGTGAAARFSLPSGLAIDAAGNVYVAEQSGYVREITPAGVVTTLKSGLSPLTGIAVDAAGNIYAGASNLYVINPAAGTMTTTSCAIAPMPSSYSGSDCTGVAVDASGTVYVTSSLHNVIRTFSPATQAFTVYAGTSSTTPGYADGTGTAAIFGFPVGVSADANGNLYVGDFESYTVRKIAAGAVVTTLAGLAPQIGSTDGVGSAARFGGSFGIAADNTGALYAADCQNHEVRKITGITGTGTVATLAGSTTVVGSADGTGSAASFSCPAGIVADSSNNLYVTDSQNNNVRKVTPAGVVTTLAGSAGTSGSMDGTGTAASFSDPTGIAIDASGNLYVADSGNHLVRMITPAGVVTTLAGQVGVAGAADGTGTAATFGTIMGIGVDSSGNVYVTDNQPFSLTSYDNVLLRKITPAGAVTTLLALPNTVEGYGLTLDSSGNVYVASMLTGSIDKITPAGTVSVLAGVPGTFPAGVAITGIIGGGGGANSQIGNIPGPLPATLSMPVDVAVSGGELYISTATGVLMRADLF